MQYLMEVNCEQPSIRVLAESLDIYAKEQMRYRCEVSHADSQLTIISRFTDQLTIGQVDTIFNEDCLSGAGVWKVS